MAMIKSVKTREELFTRLQKREQLGEEFEDTVREILQDVRDNGDQALLAWTEKFDQVKLTPAQLRVQDEEIEAAYAAYKEVSPELIDALRLARDRIFAFHSNQKPQDWFMRGFYGEVLGQIYQPIRRVGIYVPGGTAAYPSSVLMNAVPAKVAGVSEIVMVTPPGKDGRVNPLVLVAAAEAGVTEIYKVGGVQAIAALAYGTETIPRVEKIVGPGNIYVTVAKKLVFGVVDIDMLAGPSEIVVVADDSAEAELVAADLLSQAEHDPRAAVVLLTPSLQLASQVQSSLEKQLRELPRQRIAAKSLEDFGSLLVTRDLEEAVEVANELAPEHLELLVREPFALLSRIRNAGAVFLGKYAPEPFGDYLAGPNHVLPTGGTARFYSVLGVEDFLKRTSIIYGTREALKALGPDIVRLADAEGLDAHARSVSLRLQRLKDSGD
ncbi:MAG: Histidinol dehydrogenase [Thermoanaerobacterales bacterium 50_218]|nr:MAG: Histidinol dehydrogenase [Thermoanaerobacterales bacterium 50_218]